MSVALPSPVEPSQEDLTNDGQNSEEVNPQAKAAEDFYEFILSEEAKEVFDSYYFDTDVER